MMANLNRPWTDDERKRLAEVIDAGVSAERAVTIFKRSSKSIRYQAYVMGKQFLSVKRRRAPLKVIEQASVVFPRSVPMKKSFAQKEAESWPLRPRRALPADERFR